MRPFGVMSAAELVRAARERQAITVAELAVRADIPQQTIVALEAGATIDRALLERLLLVMGERLIEDSDGGWRSEALPRAYDRQQLAQLAGQPPAVRLRHALGWNSFAARVAAAGDRARRRQAQ
jgi:DNA-binding XRE family transcriptional regulator